jgi:hypothetical protein
VYRVGPSLRAAAGLREVDVAGHLGLTSRGPEKPSVRPPEPTTADSNAGGLNETPATDVVRPPDVQGKDDLSVVGGETPTTENGKPLTEEGRSVPSHSEGTSGLDDLDEIPPWHALARRASEGNGDSPAVALSANERDWIVGLVAEFDAVLVKDAPLCRYPQHRGSDWTNDGGRAICGVCHPRAERPT